jgi:FixH
MNWGIRIVLLYAAFVTGILYLVYRSSRESIDLVEQDYYAKELRYQDRIDAIQLAQVDSMRVVFNYDKRSGLLTIDLSDSLDLNGNLHFYKPDNANHDFKLSLNGHIGEFRILTDTLARGLWRIKADYAVNDRSYYREFEFIR